MEEERRAAPGLSAGRILYLAAAAALVVGLLYSILTAAGMGGFASASLKTAAFFEGVLWTLLVSGILFGLSAYLGSSE